MAIVIPLLVPAVPGFGRAFGRVTVFASHYGTTVPLAGATVRAYVPGTSTPWPDALYADESDTAPVAFPVSADTAGDVSLWAAEPGRVELVCAHPGYGEQRIVLDLEFPPDYVSPDPDPYPQYERIANKGAPSGYAPLDAGGLLPTANLPPLAITNTFVVASEAEMLALDAQTGDVCVRADTIKNYILAADPASVLGNWTELAVSSLSGNTTVIRREEFAPAAAAAAVTLTAVPTSLLSVARNGVGQSAPAGHFGLAGATLTFSDVFAAGERVAVVYEVGTSIAVPVDSYSKTESDARFEPLDSAYSKLESDLRYVAQTLVNAKGDLLAASANDAVVRLGVGTDGQVLTADAGQTLGMRWATPTPKITVAAGAPASPATGDLWVW